MYAAEAEQDGEIDALGDDRVLSECGTEMDPESARGTGPAPARQGRPSLDLSTIAEHGTLPPRPPKHTQAQAEPGRQMVFSKDEETELQRAQDVLLKRMMELICVAPEWEEEGERERAAMHERERNAEIAERDRMERERAVYEQEEREREARRNTYGEDKGLRKPTKEREREKERESEEGEPETPREREKEREREREREKERERQYEADEWVPTHTERHTLTMNTLQTLQPDGDEERERESSVTGSSTLRLSGKRDFPAFFYTDRAKALLSSQTDIDRSLRYGLGTQKPLRVAKVPKPLSAMDRGTGQDKAMPPQPLPPISRGSRDRERRR
ncbi:hypothetical protein KIPB_005659 [Kipferlia bialata]|uniref:Uncharacterized protein n=1 Tax=Kipferlia bialata TaxID=797122 RepID=A0A9K3GIE1_9EUKA|nr:hypothetical protein KIPB_005659 [Kipferlia bialata]|eukprot:g5659.t1